MKILRALAAVLGLGLLVPVAQANELLAFGQLPSGVQVTVRRHVGNGVITKIEMEEEKGHPVYEVKFDRDDQRWEMDVAPNGRLVELKEK